MSDADGALLKKYQLLQGKYQALRRNHKKLAGVALQLVTALETYLRDEEKPDVGNVLTACSRLYPGLMKEMRDAPEPVEALVVPEGGREMEARETGIVEAVQEGEKEAAAEDEEEEEEEKEEKEVETARDTQKEYYEGFWSRPKIPRTPQI